MRLVFFRAHGVWHSVDLHCNVLLEGATQQLKRGGYIPWRAMVSDDSGLDRSILHASLPNESGASYCQGTKAVKANLSSTGHMKTIVVNCCLAQLNAS